MKITSPPSLLLLSGLAIQPAASYVLLEDEYKVTKDWQSMEVGHSNDFVLHIIHMHVQEVLDFLRDVCNRDSFDDNGRTVVSFGHRASNSAKWDSSLKRFYYGDGNGSTTTTYGTRDLIAHAFGLAITDYTCLLSYNEEESGALKEGAGDILAARFACYLEGHLTLDAWSIGEDTVVGAGNAFRYMDRPSHDGNSVDHYSNYYRDGDDEENARVNSGILTHWFYLLSQGGKHHDNTLWTNNVVLGVTIEVAFDIWYQAWTIGLNYDSTFADAAIATMDACENLRYDVTTTCQSVRDAWTEVGVVDYFWCPADECGPHCGTCCTFRDCATEDPCVTATCPHAGGQCEYDYSGCSTDNLFHLELITDKYPGETSWELKDHCLHGGMPKTVMEVDFGYYTDEETRHEHSRILRAGMYTWTIHDSTGDGICCYWKYGQGNYTIDYDGVQRGQGGEFQGSTSVTFGTCWNKLFFEDFENGWNYFSDGGDDSGIKDFESYEGSYSLRLKDGSSSSVATTTKYNVVAYKQLQVHFYYMGKDLESGDSFSLEYKADDGTETIAKTWVKGADFYNDVWYSNVVDINAEAMEGQMKFWFRMNGSNNSDKIFIDNVLFQAL